MIGLCRGILADGVITESEARFLLDWLTRNPDSAGSWIAAPLLGKLAAFLADGVLDPKEQADLLDYINGLVGGRMQEPGASSGTTSLPLDIPPPRIGFEGASFCFTGRCRSGTRTQVQQAVLDRYGEVHKAVTLETDYLVLGDLGSRDWVHSSYGRKIERAIQVRDREGNLKIVSEGHWLAEIRTWDREQDIEPS